MGSTDTDLERQRHAKRYKQSIEDGEEKSLSFWEYVDEDARFNYRSASSWATQAANTSIDMIKISLLLGSVYVALIQFGIADSFPFNGLGVGIAFGLLVISIVIFIVSYQAAGEVKITAKMENLHQHVEHDGDEKDILQMTAFDYYYTATQNTDTIQRINWIISLGIFAMMASAGTIAGALVFG